MCRFLHSRLIKIICFYLILFMAGLIPGPMEARASFILNSTKEAGISDDQSLETLQIVLENELIAEKLSKLGLDEGEIIERIEQFTSEERQVIIEKLDTIQVGGFGRWNSLEGIGEATGAAVSLAILFLMVIFLLIDSARNH